MSQQFRGYKPQKLDRSTKVHRPRITPIRDKTPREGIVFSRLDIGWGGGAESDDPRPVCRKINHLRGAEQQLRKLMVKSIDNYFCRKSR